MPGWVWFLIGYGVGAGTCVLGVVVGRVIALADRPRPGPASRVDGTP